jgi:cold shock CspA family protein
MELRLLGTVLIWNSKRKFGFIRPDKPCAHGKDCFVHLSNVLPEFQDCVEAGRHVEFTPTETEKGLSAFRVRIVA